VIRVLACLLAGWLSLPGADFAILNLKIVEGEGTVYAPGSRATRGLTIEATDEAGRPVPGVAISFQLPKEGPSGEFSNSSRNDIVTTQADGRATVWGMRWNKLSGTVSIRITGAKDGVRAGMVSTQYLDSAALASQGTAMHGSHSKLILITLAVAGAAGAGFAATAFKSSKTASPPIATLTIGPPTVVIGGPQ
jgi:hypothetical protein